MGDSILVEMLTSAFYQRLSKERRNIGVWKKMIHFSFFVKNSFYQNFSKCEWIYAQHVPEITIEVFQQKMGNENSLKHFLK